MKIVALGVGEAFDEKFYNNSHLVISDKSVILLDCGYAIPNQIWRYYPDISFIDSIFISHLHADHCFGLPPLIVRMREEKRVKPLTIISLEGHRDKIEEIIKNGYPKALDKPSFPIEFIEVKSNQKIKYKDLNLNFAYTIHSIPNLAIRIDDGRNIICYSGDGKDTEESVSLYREADMVIHECYTIDKSMKDHSSLGDILSILSTQNIKRIALTHIQRDIREKLIEYIKIKKYNGDIIIPNPMETYIL